MMSVLKKSVSISNHYAGTREKKNINYFFIFVIFLFLLSTLFDPADKVFGLKIPLYLICWGVGLATCLASRTPLVIPVKLLIYTFLMIGIPLVSITYYYISYGSEPFQGFELLKAYLFISFSALIYITRIDLLKYLCIALTVLAVAILALTAIVLIYPELYLPAYLLGGQLGIFNIDSRDYGSDVVLFQMFFVTSPMLTISIAYYFNRAHVSQKNRWVFIAITALHICAMMVAGSRNNILVALMLPLALTIYYSKRRLRIALLGAVASALFVLIFRHEIVALFDPAEVSNSVKIALLSDYAEIFSDPIHLMFGRGLGAYEFWSGRGYTYIMELTYLEVIRNFGLLLGGLMILLLLYPIVYAFILERSYTEKNIILGYAAYLVMSISNPILFSSMGMMFLGVIMANICIFESDTRQRQLMMEFSQGLESRFARSR